MSGNILNLAYTEAFNVVPLCSPVIFLYNLLFHLTKELPISFTARASISSPSHLHHHWNQQQLSQIFLTPLVQHDKFYQYSTVKDHNGALINGFFFK